MGVWNRYFYIRFIVIICGYVLFLELGSLEGKYCILSFSLFGIVRGCFFDGFYFLKYVRGVKFRLRVFNVKELGFGRGRSFRIEVILGLFFWFFMI